MARTVRQLNAKVGKNVHHPPGAAVGAVPSNQNEQPRQHSHRGEARQTKMGKPVRKTNKSGLQPSKRENRGIPDNQIRNAIVSVLSHTELLHTKPYEGKTITAHLKKCRRPGNQTATFSRRKNDTSASHEHPRISGHLAAIASRVRKTKRRRVNASALHTVPFWYANRLAGRVIRLPPATSGSNTVPSEGHHHRNE